MKIPNPYESQYYKYYIGIVLVLMALAAGLVLFGPGIKPDIDLKGGMLITVQFSQNVDQAKLATAIETVTGEKPSMRFYQSPTGHGVEIELPLKPSLDQSDAELAKVHVLQEQYDRARIAFSQGQGTQTNLDGLTKQVLDQSALTIKTATSGQLKAIDPTMAVTEAENAVADARSQYRQTLLDAVNSAVTADSVSVREVGSTLSAFFFSKTREVVLLAFLLSGIIVFIVFRSLAASFAVIFGAVADITITAGIMSLMGIPWSLATVAALLMLIGFSLDTDVMLSSRVLKRKEGTPKSRAFDAMKTGFLMNLTTVAAFGVLAAVAILLQIPTYYQIGMVATIGGIVDFVATWAGNAPLIIQYAEKKHL
ncbi:hypothetical protein HY994_05300 [Candidatus Micrarchaeota archaeon]|nr:hypothetical protein [Candidatus Micrarchaeota archaeon]